MRENEVLRQHLQMSSIGLRLTEGQGKSRTWLKHLRTSLLVGGWTVGKSNSFIVVQLLQSQLTPDQHAKLLAHAKVMTSYTERLLNRLYQRRFTKHSEFVQKTLPAQRALRELQQYIASNPPEDMSGGTELPF